MLATFSQSTPPFSFGYPQLLAIALAIEMPLPYSAPLSELQVSILKQLMHMSSVRAVFSAGVFSVITMITECHRSDFAAYEDKAGLRDSAICKWRGSFSRIALFTLVLCHAEPFFVAGSGDGCPNRERRR